MKRGSFAANRKPISGVKTVKVVVVVRLHYYLPGEELVGTAREPGSVTPRLNNRRGDP